MKAPPFIYHDPQTLSDVIGLLGKVEDLRLLAGGQSLMPMMNMRYALPEHVIDINGVSELSHITPVAEGLCVGAMTRQADIMASEDVREHVPVLVEALHHTGHVQTRARGTIGGSLCHLDPSAEQPCVAALLDATLHVDGPQGARDIAMPDWGLAYMMPSIGPDEILTSVTLKSWPKDSGHAFVEYARRHGDFAIVAVAAQICVDASNQIERVAISIAGVDVRPVRLFKVERDLVGQVANDETLRASSEAAGLVDCLNDTHATAAYRRKLAVGLTERALRRAIAHVHERRGDG